MVHNGNKTKQGEENSPPVQTNKKCLSSEKMSIKQRMRRLRNQRKSSSGCSSQRRSLRNQRRPLRNQRNSSSG